MCTCYRHIDFQNNKFHHNNETPTNLWMEYGKLCIVYASNARKSHGCKFGVFNEFYLIGKVDDMECTGALCP